VEQSHRLRRADQLDVLVDSIVAHNNRGFGSGDPAALFDSLQSSGAISRVAVRALARSRSQSSLIYGAITGIGALQLFQALPIEFRLTTASTVVDIGSGYGKLVMRLAVIYQLRYAIGVEISPRRAEFAEQAKQEAFAQGLLLPAEAASILLRQGDAFGSLEQLLRNTTHVYICAQLFRSSQVSELLVVAAAEPSVQCLISVGRRTEETVFNSSATATHGNTADYRLVPPVPPLVLVHTAAVDCAWQSEVPVEVYYYCRSPSKLTHTVQDEL
jgi:hypothetical protein